MTKYNIDIDSYIGDGAYSKQYVKSILQNNANSPITCRMNSLGGSLDHGLDIADQFADHGDVTIDMYALNASSATVASTGAKKVRMSSSASYLIHKAMTGFMEWAMVNADDIDKIIADLEAKKEDLQKFDFIIAKKYMNKTGKSPDFIMNLMKKGGWMTADEALKNGFVDEVFNTQEKVDPNNFRNQIEAFGLPTNCILSNKDLFTNIKNSFPMKKQPLLINKVLGVASLENKEDEGVYFNEEQVHKIDARIAELENQVNTLTAEKQTAVTAQQKAEGEKTEAEGKLTTANNTIEEQKTQIENLSKGAGASTKQSTQETDDDDDAPKGGDEFSNRVKKATELYNMIPDEL